MNCPTIRRRLLAQERPDQPDADLRAHLDACPACRAWQHRLLAVERQIPRLPVPPSQGKDRVLQAVRRPAEPSRTEAPIATLRPTAWRPSLQERARQKLALAFALAASLLVFALCFWAWPRHPDAPTGQPRDAYLTKLQQERDELLAANRTPRERVQLLAAMAKRLWLEARLLAHSDQDRLASLAHFYSDLVERDLLTQAREVPAKERKAVFEAVQRQLVQTESELSKQVQEELQMRAGTRAHLKAIAASSRQGYDRLEELLRETA